MNIVLDLDETLIHSDTVKSRQYDFVINLSDNIYYVQKRPGLDVFLKYIYKNFKTVSYWTAGVKLYAQAILKNILTPKQQEATLLVLSREHLGFNNDLFGRIRSYHKPLERIFKSPTGIKYGLTRFNTILVDDIAKNFQKNEGNGVLIPAFTGKQSDRALSQLIVVLNGILEMSLPIGSYHRHLKLSDIIN